jgi:hypothetical protein
MRCGKPLREGAQDLVVASDHTLTGYTFEVLSAIRRDTENLCYKLGVPFGDSYILSTPPGADSRPYKPEAVGEMFTVTEPEAMLAEARRREQTS